MPQLGREQVVSRMERERVGAIIRAPNQQVAADAMQAAVDGGIRVSEFTLTTPGALELISRFATQSDLLVGAGTVMSPAQARDAVSAGARFLVSPIFDAEVVAEAAALDAASIPGCSTPTEMEIAHRHHADFIKVFPEPADGVDFIRAVRGPLPHLRLFPTAGPTPENFLEYLEAGCVGVGLVRSLFEPEDLAARNFVAIRDRAENVVRRLSRWQKSF